MPLSPHITFYTPDGKPLSGPVVITDPHAAGLTGCCGEEFQHCVYTIRKDHFYALVHGADFVRRHEPMTIVKQLDKMSAPLMKYLVSGTFLQKVEIRWFQYNKKKGKTEEYFRMALEHVRLHSIRYFLPDVKDSTFERYDHLEKIQLMYQKITWQYIKGTILHTDIWDGAFGEFDRKDFSEKKENDEDLTEMPLVEPLRLKFTDGMFEEPKGGFAFDKKTTVKFTFTANRKPDYKENKVYAKLFTVYNGKTEDMAQINEGRLVAGNCWSTEFKFKKTQAYEKDAERKADATVEYYAVIENAFAENNYFKSGSVTLPKREEIGFIKIKLITKGGYCLKGVSCSLDGGGNNVTLTTDDNGEAVWSGLPFEQYNIILEIEGLSIKINLPWLRLDDKPFEYLFRTALSDVKKLDTSLLKVLLNALGYKCGDISSEYNHETETAVKAFQNACGISADGIAGPVTCQLLIQQTGAQ